MCILLVAVKAATIRWYYNNSHSLSIADINASYCSKLHPTVYITCHSFSISMHFVSRAFKSLVTLTSDLLSDLKNSKPLFLNTWTLYDFYILQFQAPRV